MCNGTEKVCPIDDIVVAAGTVCREAEDECDITESCDGTAISCPIDNYKEDDLVCEGDGYSWTDSMCQTGVCEDGEEIDGNCPAPVEITTFPSEIVANITGRPNHIEDYGTDCDAISASGSDVIYEVTLTEGKEYEITVEAAFDVALAVPENCGDNETCSYTANEFTDQKEIITFIAEQDETIILVVETISGSGEYTLNIIERDAETPDEIVDEDTMENDDDTGDSGDSGDDTDSGNTADIDDAGDDTDDIADSGDDDTADIDDSEDDSDEVEDDVADSGDDDDSADTGDSADDSGNTGDSSVDIAADDDFEDSDNTVDSVNDSDEVEDEEISDSDENYPGRKNSGCGCSMVL